MRGTAVGNVEEVEKGLVAHVPLAGAVGVRWLAQLIRTLRSCVPRVKIDRNAQSGDKMGLLRMF